MLRSVVYTGCLNMHIRRLVKSGAASHTVSLPKNWIERNSLKRGDLIHLRENSDNELIISTKGSEGEKETKEIVINVDNKKLDTLGREITSAYINNYNSIVLIGKKLDKNVKEVRKMLHDFVALEITEQTSTKIVANDLLNLKEISVDKTVRRMDMVVRSIIEDSIQGLGSKDVYKSVYYRDFDVNKLYFLMFRILKGALNDIKVAQTFDINGVEALSNWYLAVNIENIADNAKEICKLFSELEEELDLDGVRELYKIIQRDYLDVMKAFFNKDKNLADSIISRRTNLIDKCDLYFENYKSVSTAQIIGNFKELETYVCNIAKIVIDH